jgi:hypothetical protein
MPVKLHRASPPSVIDAFEALAKALIRFLQGLRSKIGARRLILLIPVEEVAGDMTEAPADRCKTWQRAARQLGDPFLGVPDAQAGETRHEK